MPTSFPADDFEKFGIAASDRFLPLMSEENHSDPQERRRQFDWSWRAVRLRYRTCVESSEEFKRLLSEEAGERFVAGMSDEELLYKLERCIYVFFMSGLSIFDSFAFCLYFYGNALDSATFPKVSNPHTITRSAAAGAFAAAFPQARITKLLQKLLPDDADARFNIIYTVRNLVGHRLSGRRSVRGLGTTHEDGRYSYRREDTWYIPGLTQQLVFNEKMLQDQLENIAGLLNPRVSAAREFAEQHQLQAQP
jgi:hypothetical protein